MTNTNNDNIKDNIMKKFKITLLGLIDRLTIVCVRLDNYEKPSGFSSYDKICLAKVAITSTEPDILLKHYDKIFSKYKTYIENKNIEFFKNIQIYPGIKSEDIGFVFRMFDCSYGLNEKEKTIIWKIITKLVEYIDKLQI